MIIQRFRQKSKKKKQKGVALIAALFTVAIVLILSISFLGMAFKESRAAAAENESTLALQVANTGAELMFNYMSVSDNWEYTSNAQFLNVLKAFPSTPNRLKQNTLASGEQFNFVIQRNWVNNSFFNYNVSITPHRHIGAGNAYLGVNHIELRQAIFNVGQPPGFIMISTGSIHRRNADGSMAATPIATRRLQFKFRPKSASDNLLFTQNYRGWMMAGSFVAPPNSVEGTNDCVGIPSNFIANGPVTIDGNSAFATETAGNIKFFNTDGVQFYGPVSISQDDNVFPPGTSQEAKDAVFAGGIKTGQASIGLPERDSFMTYDYNGNGSISGTERGTAVQLALDNTGRNENDQPFVKAFYSLGDNQGFPTPAGIIGHSRCTDPQSLNNWYEYPNNANPNNYYEQMHRTIPADIEFDGDMINSKPGLASWNVEFFPNGTVTLKKKTAYTKQETTILNRVSVDRFKNGILYLEGGNVNVKGTFKGQLSIVSAEAPLREAHSYTVKTADGRNIVQYSTETRNQQVYPNNPEYWTPGKIVGAEITEVVPRYSNSSNYVPYNDSRLPERVNANGEPTEFFDRIPPYKIGGKWVWPSETSINNHIVNTPTTDGDIIGLYSDQAREGNIIITDNIEYADGSNNALGLIAKNFILLPIDSGKGPNPQLTVNAVLMSFDKSVQYDDTLLTGSLLSGYDDQRHEPNLSGSYNFLGSYIGAFADVEARYDINAGFMDQTLMFDTNLKNTLPPNFPKWDVVRMSNEAVINFVVLSYQDLGSIRTN